MADNERSISTAGDGPFIVNGGVPLRSQSKVTSDAGEPMTWRPGPISDTLDGAALCRCGQSANKPFCDGSHKEADWDPTDGITADSSSADRARVLEGPALSITDDKMLCMHAGFCGTERTNVWEMVEDTNKSEVKAKTIRMVEKCPSGRLTNVIDGDSVEQSLPIEVGVVPDGPLWVTGGIPMSNAAGEAMETRNRVTLCRCGASSLKPLCDGSHADAGFKHSM